MSIANTGYVSTALADACRYGIVEYLVIPSLSYYVTASKTYELIYQYPCSDVAAIIIPENGEGSFTFDKINIYPVVTDQNVMGASLSNYLTYRIAYSSGINEYRVYLAYYQGCISYICDCSYSSSYFISISPKPMFIVKEKSDLYTRILG